MNKSVFKTLKIILILLLIGLVFTYDINTHLINRKDLLNLIITINGILIAVIATFLYSKILNERTERIQIKVKIDKISYKLNNLRRIAKIVRSSTHFWIKPTNIILNTYPSIDIFKLRGFGKDKLNDFLKTTKMGELNAQAYLAIVKIIGDDKTQLSINPNYRYNYNLQLLSEYIECCSLFYSYCNEYHNRIRIEDWENIKINELVFKINPLYKNLNARELGELFSDFSTKEIEELYQLTSENKRPIGGVFYWIFINITISFICLVIAILSLAYMNPKDFFINISLFGTIWIIADLVLNTYYSLKNEIIINQFYV